jgi:tetratricopeptide (TPR) repeat protein
MDTERQAQIVKQTPSNREQAAHARRVVIGQRALESFAVRALEGAHRLGKGAVAAELFAAVAETYEDVLGLDPKQSLSLFQRALQAHPDCRAATQGLRRLARMDGDAQGTLDLLEHELRAAESNREDTTSLHLEIARALLYQADQPRLALLRLEDIEAARKLRPGASWMGMKAFLLWEQALWATSQWKRYEELLREAIAQQDGSDPSMARALEARLLLLYEQVLPDRTQADIVLEHLHGLTKLDPAQLGLMLQKREREGAPEAQAELLRAALSSPACADREAIYRLLLADLQRYSLNDPTAAAQTLRDGLRAVSDAEGDEGDEAALREGARAADPMLLHALVDVQRARGDIPALIDALGMSLDLLEQPQERAHALYNIGLLLLESLSMSDDAEAMLSEALREWPNHEPSLRLMSRRLIERGDWAGLAALQEAALTVSDDPKRWRAHAEVALLYELRLQQLPEALAHYRAALQSGDPCWSVALQGAVRAATELGLWVELTEVLVAAEQATKESAARVALLEHIARVADDHLNDAATAIKALEALRLLEPQHGGALVSLSRLYTRLHMHEALIALNVEALAWTEDLEQRAALQCTNAELHLRLQQRVQAEQCYREALTARKGYLPAAAGLHQMLALEGRWEQLLLALLEHARAIGDADMQGSVRAWQEAAAVLDHHLGRPAEAVELHWRCLRSSPRNALSRDALIRHFTAVEDWQQVSALLEQAAENAPSPAAAAATLLKLARLRQLALGDEEGAFDALRRGYLSCPDAPALLHLWLKSARALGRTEEVQRTLMSMSAQPQGETARVELLLALSALSVKQTHDPLTAAGYLDAAHGLEAQRGLNGLMLSMALARSGRWEDATGLALQAHMPSAERVHGLEAALVQGVPARLRAGTEREMNALADGSVTDAERAWLLCPPSRRPPHHHLPSAVRHAQTRGSQALRRWLTMRTLAAGHYNEPASTLLNDNATHNINLQPDLELLAAFYEQTRQWDMLLQVLAAQEEASTLPAERVRLCVERCKVFDQLGRHAEALEAVHGSLQVCDFDDPARDALYDRLEEGGDWEMLISELRRQLMHVDHPEKQSSLWLRLARVYERGPKDFEESLRALDSAYRAFPSDGALLSDIARVAEGLGEHGIARRALDDYLVYHRPDIEQELGLAARLARLHMEHSGGDPKRVLAWLDDLSSRSCDDPRALKAYAEAHAKGGSPLIACEVLGRVLKMPYRSADLPEWLMLAALYGGAMSDPMRAESLYWDLMGHFPDEDLIWSDIEAFYQSDAGLERIVERLDALLRRAGELGLSAEQQRRFLGRQAQVLGDKLGRWHEAQDVLHKALGLGGPVSADMTDLSKQRAYALCHIQSDIPQAYEALCELLVENPFQPDVLRQALTLCERAEAFDRARVLRQVAKCFMPAHEDLHLEDDGLRPKVMPTRPLEAGALKARLLHPMLRGALYDVLHEALPIVEHVERDRLPTADALGGKRLRGPDNLVRLFDEVGVFLGFGGVKVFLTHDESPEPVVLATPPSLCIPSTRWESLDDAERRHWAGYAAGVLWTGLSPLAYLDGRSVWQLLDGVFYSQTGEGVLGAKTAYTLEAAEKIKSPWLRRSRKEVAELLGALAASDPEVINPERAPLWSDWILATGDRCGLIFSGDISTSLRALLAGQGWDDTGLQPETITRHMQSNERVKHLLRFAFSDDHLHLRYAAGLASKPSILS